MFYKQIDNNQIITIGETTAVNLPPNFKEITEEQYRKFQDLLSIGEGVAIYDETIADNITQNIIYFLQQEQGDE